MKIIDLALSGVKLVEPQVFCDERGYFLETYRETDYRERGISCAFVQDNHSYSKKGTLRGMHFQALPGQAKLVSVVRGEIFDVVVDIRPHSPTFRKWLGVRLNAREHQQLFIPVGYAHGFCVLSEEADVCYKVSSHYDPAQEKTFRYDDPDVGIEWPVEASYISPKDLAAPYLRDCL